MLMVTGFLGYVLPWGLMSYWGATVITSLGTGIPCMVPWLWGGSLPGTDPGGLCRYFIVHPVLPLPVPLPLDPRPNPESPVRGRGAPAGAGGWV